jgi:uncharacterized membrane protein
MDQWTLAIEIAKTEIAISKSITSLIKYEKQLNTSQRNYKVGVVGVFIGIIILFVFWKLGLLFVIISIFVMISERIKQNKTKSLMQENKEPMIKLQIKRATYRAQLEKILFDVLK